MKGGKEGGREAVGTTIIRRLEKEAEGRAEQRPLHERADECCVWWRFVCAHVFV